MHPTIARHTLALMERDPWWRHEAARWRLHLAAHYATIDASTLSTVWMIVRRYERYEADAADLVAA